MWWANEVSSDQNLTWLSRDNEERDANGNVTRRAFTHGEEVAMVTVPIPGLPPVTVLTPRYFATDHLGSVTEVTDAAQTVLGRYAFDPWGRRSLTSGADITTIGFTGHGSHETSGTHLAFYRAYDENLGRWLSEDPQGLEDGPNLFLYVGGNPIVWTDPDGRAASRCSLRVLAMLTAAVIATCKTPTGCFPTDSCNLLRLKILTKHILAQTALTRRCYPNDPTHKQQIQDERNGIRRCQSILAEKQKGCGCQ